MLLSNPNKSVGSMTSMNMELEKSGFVWLVVRTCNWLQIDSG